MLDGVPVKYVSLSQEELGGVIKDSGYLCGCQSCNYSKALDAYEFECHAGCKTKHPNNHIYFENGKTIYQTVQELRSTPESMLFDVIQTVFGAPINQKSFHIWKDHKSNSGLSYPLRSNALAVLKSMNSDSCTQSSSALTFSCLQTTLIRLELGSKDMVLSQIF